MSASERVTTERLVLVSRVDCCFLLDEPTLISAGQTYWLDRERGELSVDRGDGRVTRHSGRREH